jgi:hypothetical protein
MVKRLGEKTELSIIERGSTTVHFCSDDTHTPNGNFC